MTTVIHVLNGSSVSVQKFEQILSSAGRILEHPVQLEPSPLDIHKAFDSSRGQYNSTALLAQILTTTSPSGEKWIAVVDVDLYVPVLTFVYGEAQFNGSAAIVSTHRLANQFYGIPQDDRIFLERLEKEMIHELGHTFGLYHCRQFDCVMHSSTYVEEIDLKRTTPCPECKSFLLQTTKSS